MYQKETIGTRKSVLLAAGAVLFCALFPLSAYALTSVSNDVSVSANGNGDAHTSIQTIIDGEVVEDVEIDGNGTYSNTVSASGTTVHTSSSNTITRTNAERDEEIRTLIAKLMKLIEHYVSLLNAIT